MSDSKNIEITLRSQEEERNIDFSAIGRRVRALKGFIAKLLVGALVVGLVAGAVKNVVGSSSKVQTVVTFGFDGIEEGLDPNGAVFDISKMASPAVVQPALDSLEMADKVTADTVRQAMSFEGVIPQDALDRISIIQTVSEKVPQALEELLDVSYHPIEYRVTLDLKKAGVDAKTGVEILDAINSAYRDWFLETYSHQEALGSSVGVVDYSSYDYSEAADLLKVQLDTASRYVQALQAKAPDFRSTNTNLTFADLRSNLDAISSVDMSKLYSLIIVNRLTKDAASLQAYYSYQIRTTTNSLNEAQEQLQAVEAAIAGYEKSTAVIYGEGMTPTTMTSDSAAYDDLFSKQVSASNNVARLRVRLNELQQNYDALTNPEAQVATTPNAKATVEELLVSVPEKLYQCMTQINDTAMEYYETVAYRNAFRVDIPAQKTGGVGLMGMAKDCITFAVLLEVLACMVIVGVVVVTTLLSGEFYKKSKKEKHAHDPLPIGADEE